MTSPVFHVLLAMADGETHGYRIMQEVAERSRGTVKLGPGSLYFTINRLTDAKMIEESSERPDPAMDGLETEVLSADVLWPRGSAVGVDDPRRYRGSGSPEGSDRRLEIAVA